MDEMYDFGMDWNGCYGNADWVCDLSFHAIGELLDCNIYTGTTNDHK
jgi:hypothetical protein